MAVSLSEQIFCIEREIGFRKRLYPRWIRDGKLTQKAADIELARMGAVLCTLMGVDARMPEFAEVRRGAEARVLNMCAPHMNSSRVVAIERALFGGQAAYCPKCERVQPTIDEGETCAVCKLVL